MDNSLYWVTIYSKQQLVAMGRVVGDGEIYFYILDVLVHPEHQGKGYGLANIEHQIPLNSKSVFRMASVSKQFTAFAVLLLVEQGKINLDDDIRQHLTDLPDYGVKVTINSMVGHFSGMADYDTLKELLPSTLLSAAGGPFRLGDEDYLTNEEYYNVMKSLPLENQPDTKQAYSNFAYYLLSELVARLSGLSMREYTTKYMFEPLGMHSTFFADDMREIVPNRAEGYRTFKNGGLKRYEKIFLLWVMVAFIQRSKIC